MRGGSGACTHEIVLGLVSSDEKVEILRCHRWLALWPGAMQTLANPEQADEPKERDTDDEHHDHEHAAQPQGHELRAQAINAPGCIASRERCKT